MSKKQMMKTKKIAFFIPSLTGGGAERVTLNLAKELLRRGLEVDLVIASDTISYHSLIPQEASLFNLKSSRVLFALPKLIRYLREAQPDALLSAMSHANLIALWAKLLSKVSTRVIVSERSTLSACVANSRNQREKTYPFLMRRFYSLADGIIAVSEGVASDLMHQGIISREEIRVIYNPTVTSDLLQKKHEAIECPWFLPDTPPVILAAGRLTTAKSFSTLIDAFALLRTWIPAHLLILGEGEERENLETQINSLGLSDFVSMPGFVENPFAYMAQADVFVLSSKWEGLPNVLIEAMACGTSVVSTNCPSGPAEILENGQYGILTPVGDSSSLAKAIRKTLDNPVSSQILQQRANDFSVEKIVDQYLEILE